LNLLATIRMTEDKLEPLEVINLNYKPQKSYSESLQKDIDSLPRLEACSSALFEHPHRLVKVIRSTTENKENHKKK